MVLNTEESEVWALNPRVSLTSWVTSSQFLQSWHALKCQESPGDSQAPPVWPLQAPRSSQENPTAQSLLMYGMFCFLWTWA